MHKKQMLIKANHVIITLKCCYMADSSVGVSKEII